MKIAVIGTGIAGLSAAHLLSQKHTVTLFEKNDYIGGHSNTVTIPTADGSINVDTGFIVFNHRNYPNLRRLFQDLRIPTLKGDMSFAVSNQADDFEFCSDWPNGIFADWTNFIRPSYWRFLKGIATFNRQANKDLDEGVAEDLALKDYLTQRRVPLDVIEKYLIPMLAAIWSAPYQNIMDFPIATLLHFLDNHGFLSINNRPKWYTVSQGSRTYVRHLIAPLKDNIVYNAVVAVTRKSEGVIVTTLLKGEICEEQFDQVVIATHADEALQILKTKTPLEEETLSHITYQENITYLHQDSSMMPKRRAAWASWNTLLTDKPLPGNHAVCVTYWMNRLQNISKEYPLFVTLNPPPPS